MVIKKLTPLLFCCRRCRRRFTLVEVVCSIVITSLIIAGAVALINVLQWGMERSSRTSRATAIASSRIEQLRAGDYEELEGLEESAVRVNDQGVPSSDGIYQRTTRIDRNSTSHTEVTVEVSAPWRPGKADIEVDLTTVIINPELLLEDF